MVSTAFGAGVLSLSYAFVLSGWLVGIVLLLIGLVAGIYSNLMIVELAVKHNLANLD